ncbi:hypothetical protein ACP275_08G040100 [Erythranthe tilingii]
MFSKNSYLHPQATSSSSSSYPRGSYDLNSVEFLLHHHPELFSGHYLSTAAAATSNSPLIHSAALMLNQDTTAIFPNGDPSSAAANTHQRKQTVKKDRHSKIFTAQGPRDRRVRLSIGIARKFFDLQEMLGFDKPSKTLDWLLTKSKAAIKDLVQMKHNAAASCSKSTSSPSSDCELVISSESNAAADPFEIEAADTKRKCVKESRAKARARARERTREKMCFKNNNLCCSDLNPLVPIHFRNNNNSNNNNNNQVGFFQSTHGGAGGQDLVQESSVVKRKMKNPSFFGALQQNVFVSRDSSSNYGGPSPNNTNAAENWDFFASQSNLCAILDQHKFINSSNM